MNRLEGRVAVVTGAGHGIGRGIVRSEWKSDDDLRGAIDGAVMAAFLDDADGLPTCVTVGADRS